MTISDFALSYSICPIYLTGGVAGGGLAGGTVAITEYLQGSNYSSLLAGGTDDNLDNFFAHFVVLAGGRLVNQTIGEYPFANQATAANAVIRQPINITLMMICPARGPGGYTGKQAVLGALKTTLDQHNNSGGTYSVNTPAMLYTDCILKELVDVSGGESKQVQYRWQWVFEKPLVTLSEATAAQNNLMSRISSGAKVTPNASGEISYSGIGNTVGNSASGASPFVSPPNTADQGLGYTSPAFAPTSGPFAAPPTQVPADNGFGF